MAARLEQWVRETESSLTESNSDDIHTNELGIEPNEVVGTSLQVFAEIVEAGRPYLEGIVLMLMIPLRDSRPLRFAPHWRRVPKLLSQTPPSFYILRPRSYFQPDDSTRLVSPVEGVPGLPSGSFAEFRCWKNERLSPSEPWARDIRIVSIGR
jgi:hypothetical protein